MSSNPRGWEATLLAFVIILTVLVGIAYQLALVYRFPIPWLALIALAVLGALLLRRLRRR